MTGGAVGDDRRCNDSCRDLDALLFAPSGWFAIDASNRRVPGVTPGTLEQALALIGHGRVATVVGQLRPEVVGVDIDAGGALGDEAAAAVRNWCVARRLWHLQRPSGGAPGRWHVVVVPGVHADDLALHIAAVRRELRLSGKQLDRRTQLRPLSAPHRRTRALYAQSGLDEALPALRAVLEPLPDRIRASRAAAPGSPTPSRAGGPDAPVTPLARPRRPLPGPWAAYLTHGRPAAAAVDRAPDERSQIELEATFALVVAGYTEPDAWAAITAAHPTTFIKARGNGRRWWWHQWNRAVIDADAWLRERRAAAATSPASGRASAEVLHAVQGARAALEAAWRTWPARTRHTDAEVYTVVLERMARVDALAVAIPQRDLVLDCAVASRTTVRAALNRLQAVGLLQVVPTYVPGTTDTAHTLALPAQLTADSGAGEAVSLIGPSRFQPPQRAPALTVRRALGLTVTAVLTWLPCALEPALDLRSLAQAAGLVDLGQDAPTSRQLRTLRAHLRTLAQQQLVDVDEHGRWHRLAPSTVSSGVVAAPDSGSTGELAVAARGSVLDAAVFERVGAERAAFRARMETRARRARWEAQRQAAVVRAAKAARARQRAWWEAQSLDERERRRTALSTAFSALAPAEQARRKHALAEARACGGGSESDRYAGWLEEVDPAELEQRRLNRAALYAGRPLHEQQQLAAAWAEHRARWRLPHRRRATPPTPLATATVLRRQPPDTAQVLDELTLFMLDLPGAAAARAG